MTKEVICITGFKSDKAVVVYDDGIIYMNPMYNAKQLARLMYDETIRVSKIFKYVNLNEPFFEWLYDGGKKVVINWDGEFLIKGHFSPREMDFFSEIAALVNPDDFS